MPRKIGNSGIIVADMVVINNFTFCKDHGEEACPIKCQYDFMFTNNCVIMDEKEVVEASKKGIELPSPDMRPSINCYRLGAIPVDKNDPLSEACYCSKHRKIDCETCFNWAKILLKGAY
ncbi:hypothetical protein BJ165DRAFT_1008347 [Panaeolus papilionaceus]|nr:hypothetical protein BJ165DRAFT_1008347 [Panaeolus papilionaceus]